MSALLEALRAAEYDPLHMREETRGDQTLEALRAAEADPVHARPEDPSDVVTVGGPTAENPPEPYNPVKEAWEKERFSLPNVVARNVRETMHEILRPNPDEDEGEHQVRVAAVSAAQDDPEVAPAVNEVVTKNPNASVEEVTATYSKAKAESIKRQVEEEGGWSAGFEEAWGSFNEKVDLFTLGAALMATNGNGKSLTANLGVAIAAGAQAKQAQKDRLVATEAAAREETRATREESRKDADTISKRINAEANALRAATQAARAGAGLGPPPGTNKTVEAMITRELGHVDADTDSDSYKAYITALSGTAQTAMEMRSKGHEGYKNLTNKQIIEAVIAKERQSGAIKPNTMIFGIPSPFGGVEID